MVICICLGLLAQTVCSYPNVKELLKASLRRNHRRCQLAPVPSPSPIMDPKPCKDKVSNGTVETPEGTIYCEVPSREQLLSQLKEIGGANPNYVATTKEEADNFPNLLPNVNLRDIYYCDESPPGTHNNSHPWWPWHSKSSRRRCEKEYDDSAGKRSDIPGSKVTDIRCFVDGTRDLNTGRKILCNRCQQKRELPTGYLPQYFNELSCGSGVIGGVRSKKCDNNYGSCLQNFLLMPILRYQKDECTTSGGKTTCKQVWVKDTAKLRSCCECQF